MVFQIDGVLNDIFLFDIFSYLYIFHKIYLIKKMITLYQMKNDPFIQMTHYLGVSMGCRPI